MGPITLKKLALMLAGVCAFLLIGVGEWPLLATVVGIVAWSVYALA